ncbi:hypothetical protein [uncultured Solobacterium sp.]|uniref:hypothetical protein n=1 Tax=uncultured Solobacterium sp. TaxID=747375 RepID=UPI002614045A|nr:hypothetical protein [uncultured Solobacterium sp.]
MPNLKVKKGNDTLTFELTDNLRDVGEKRLPIVINGKTYYARLGGDKTALVVQRTSNSAKSYVQTNPVSFTTWNWQKYTNDVRGTEKMFVYLPKGRYRATVYNAEHINDFTINNSMDIEVNVRAENLRPPIMRAYFNINGWSGDFLIKHDKFTIKIERIGE